MTLDENTASGLSIETLSIGRGVPAKTRSVYQQIKKILADARNRGII